MLEIREICNGSDSEISNPVSVMYQEYKRSCCAIENININIRIFAAWIFIHLTCTIIAINSETINAM